jgi:Amt family ammonium transporter
MLGATAFGQAAAPAAAPPAAAPPPSAAELKDTAAKAPTTTQLQAGDPGGSLTGTVNDVPVSDPKTGLTLGDTANQVGQNKIAINFVWTLVTGFLVMFMQAGFAMVESGLCRVKNANHTYMMNFFVYGCGLLAYWLIGFAIQMGGAAGNSNLGGLQSLSVEHPLSLFGKTWGIFGGSGMVRVFQTSFPVSASSDATLPWNVQHSYFGPAASISSAPDLTPMITRPPYTFGLPFMPASL